MVPAFCVVMQSVPERPTTLVVLGFVSFCLFYLSVFETANFRVTAVVPEMVSGPARVLQAVPSQVAQAGQEILASLGKSLVILLLTLYASICHGPVTSVSAQTQRYTSFEFLNNKLYVNPPVPSPALPRLTSVMPATAWLCARLPASRGPTRIWRQLICKTTRCTGCWTARTARRSRGPPGCTSLRWCTRPRGRARSSPSRFLPHTPLGFQAPHWG